MIDRKQFIRGCVLSLACLALGSHALAQDKFPGKPLKIVVTFGAGGSGDLMARSLAQSLGEVLGQQVVVENRAGGSGIPGTEYVAKAPADGYTLLQYTNALAVNMVLQPNVPYDLFRDFTPLAHAFEGSLVLLTPGVSPNRKLPELLAHAKGKPISFGHGGIGSMSHLSGELFKRAMRLDAVSVAYKGNGPALNDLLAGRLDYYFSTVADMLPNIKAGKLHALAVTSAQRDPLLPDVPTMVELGYKDFTPQVTWGYLVPKNTPAPIVKQLQEAIAKAITLPGTQERLKSVGASSANAGGGDVMTAKMKAEIARWDPVIKAANIKPD